MYAKHSTSCQLVTAVVQKTDAQGNHKTFVRNQETRFVFIVDFQNGYKAEFTLATTHNDIVGVDDYLEFRVVDVPATAGLLPTIEILNVNPSGREKDKDKTTHALSSNGMAGHPAVYALGYAVQLAPHCDWDSDDVVVNASKFLSWLLENR